VVLLIGSTPDQGGGGDRAAGQPQRDKLFQPAAPAPLDLPKPGGSLRGLGEKFKAGAPTGTGGLSLPLPVSTCRGVEPALALTYDSGRPQGPFGMGWDVPVPEIVRRTDKGLPRYADADDGDIFILSGQEDLVPTEAADLGGAFAEAGFQVDLFRPRVEGLFARVERCTNLATGQVHWRSITADNVTSLFGLSPSALVADPKNSAHVFKWRLEATFDAFGHVTYYQYKPEDLAGVSASDLAEASRFASPPANAYLKSVSYGNRMPLATREPSIDTIAALSFLFLVVFDYGEHTTDLPAEAEAWGVRADTFSSFRSGFEIRTYRLCSRVLMFHQIPEELGAPARLVKALQLGYDPSPTVTYLTSARLTGYEWDATGAVTTAQTPALNLDYTRASPLSMEVQNLDPASLGQIRGNFGQGGYRFVDLDGEGIPGLLTPAASAAGASSLYYKRNLGQGTFAPAQPLPTQPTHRTRSDDMRLVSLNSDGRLDLVELEGPAPGYFERTRDFDWTPFRPFASAPKLDYARRGVHFLDIDGDGITDILVAEDNVFVWYPSLSRDGYGAPKRVTQSHDERRAAVVLTTDDYETIFLADMSGDGLSDLVRIRNGEACYWPNLGYGRFGPKISMTSAPLFDTPGLFDPRRVRLGDIDGTGPSDIVYLSTKGATVYLNEAGNGFAPGVAIPLPIAGSLDSVEVVDLLGTGTACLVWSSSAPATASTSLRYVDLLQSRKPHLLCTVDNGIGATASITYAPSTQFYLEDAAAGRPWATRLPFVVQTVAQVQTTDAIAKTVNVMRYRYAHGLYDGVEREFRGFGRVDAWDADTVSSDHGAGPTPPGLDGPAGVYDLPPAHTISWFHTGAWGSERDDLVATLSAEYWAGDPDAVPLGANTIPTTLLSPDLREAYRSMKGKPLRTEIYAEDGSDLAGEPYAVTAYRYDVWQIQPIGANRHGVYVSFQREQAAYHYERNASDPRIQHQLSLVIDPLGHVTQSASIAYARREPNQGAVLATCSTETFAGLLSAVDDFRHGVATEAERYELALGPTSQVLDFNTVAEAVQAATPLPFDGVLAAGTKRLISHVQHQFWADDLSAALPQGQVGARALAYGHRALAMPATLLTMVFAASGVTVAEMTSTAGYVSPDGDFWTQSGTTTYDGANFYQAISFTDPFGNVASVAYDALRLFVVEQHTSANAAFDNVTSVAIDYRVLASSLLTDPNGNQTAVAFDPLGMLTALAVMGTAGSEDGDTLADPTTCYKFDLLAWETDQAPIWLHTLAREQHGPANPGWFETYSYVDGSGRPVLKKVQAQPDATGVARWVGNGRTVFDNKANPVKTYEPYFASDPGYDDEDVLVAAGYCTIMRYDPLSRLIRTDAPDGVFSTVDLGPWGTTSSDAVDTVLGSAWYADASSRPTTDPLNRAAMLAKLSANTPATTASDPLGRTVLSVANNRPAGLYTTRSTLDIQGNVLTVTDPVGTLAVSQVFDAQGNVLQSRSADAGTLLTLMDGIGRPYRSWDARGFAHRQLYDPLHRPTQRWVTPPGGAEFLANQAVYGEGLATANFRGRLYQQFDGAGVMTNAAYDFEGRVTRALRQVASDYTTAPAWDRLATLTDPTSFLPAAASLLDPDVFETVSAYDALSRIMSVTAPDQTRLEVTYDNASFLGSIDAFLAGSATATAMVSNVDYNARGQRTAIAYGLGVSSQYTYDDRTHRVTQVQTIRQSDRAALQDLSYTYDPVGNVVQVSDGAQQTVYFAGSVTDGTQLFEYDAIYRLTSASGREQPGQVGYALGSDGYAEAPFMPIPDPHDLQALLAYAETYAYDNAGNLMSTVHTTTGTVAPNWTRTQTYVAGCNRLDRVSMPGDPAGEPYSGVFVHDASGNMTATSNLSALMWDHDGLLVSANLGGGGTAYFTYDAAGQRVRKAVVRQQKTLDRIYVGGFERYRETSGATVFLERISVHVEDGQRRFALVETKTVDTSAGPSAALIRLQFPNQLGSACLETEPTGAPISYEEYFPFGGSSYRAGDVDKRYRFSSKERDEESGLYYHGARYYAPWLARWVSCDPAGLADGPNPYVYARNRPTCLTDPTGMASQDYSAVASVPEPESTQSTELANRNSSASDRAIDVENEQTRLAGEALTQGTGTAPSFTPGELSVWIGTAVQIAKSQVASKQVQAAETQRSQDIQQANEKEAVVQAQLPQGLAAAIPVYGNAKSAYVRFQHGDYGLAATDAGLALSDIALVKSAAVGVGKLVGEGALPRIGEALKLFWSDTRGEIALGGKLASPTETVTTSGVDATTSRLQELAARARVATSGEEDLITQAKQIGEGDPSRSGTALHDLTGAAPRGIDFRLSGGLDVELKSHWTGAMTLDQLTTASEQSLGYALKYQQQTGLVRLRQVVHVFVDPRGGPSLVLNYH
jgi:RHS repeat-associated protein